jgi:hypothetical protein
MYKLSIKEQLVLCLINNEKELSLTELEKIVNTSERKDLRNTVYKLLRIGKLIFNNNLKLTTRKIH